MSRHQLLAALALGSALVLSGCATAQTPETAPEKVATGDSGPGTGSGSGADTDAQQEGGSGDAPEPGTADAATQEYLDCLIENGVDAIIDARGQISLGVAAQKGGTIETGSDTASSPAAAAQATCQEQVPDYAAPNLNDK
jgi:hypothetical protein